jgi:glucose/arabinose dehydrogenase
MAFAPDGRLFIAEDAGRILSIDVSGGIVQAARVIADPQPGSRLLAVTLDPRFDDTHLLYALWAEPSKSGDPAFTIARFTESRGVLFDRVVLVDGVEAASDPHGMLRFGPDGKLYAAFDDGNDPRRAADLASRNGKVLRMNADGTTPDDQDNLTPVFAYGFRAPHALDWQPPTRELWIADANETGRALLYALRPMASPRQRGVVRAAFNLPQPTTATSVAFYRGRTIPAFENNLLVASDEAQHLLRVRFDPADPGRIVSTERLLQGVVGSVRVVTQAPDGTVFLGTATTVGRIAAALP